MGKTESRMGEEPWEGTCVYCIDNREKQVPNICEILYLFLAPEGVMEWCIMGCFMNRGGERKGPWDEQGLGH